MQRAAEHSSTVVVTAGNRAQQPVFSLSWLVGHMGCVCDGPLHCQSEAMRSHACDGKDSSENWPTGLHPFRSMQAPAGTC